MITYISNLGMFPTFHCMMCKRKMTQRDAPKSPKPPSPGIPGVYKPHPRYSVGEETKCRSHEVVLPSPYSSPVMIK